jgi:hypothetical protein
LTTLLGAAASPLCNIVISFVPSSVPSIPAAVGRLIGPFEPFDWGALPIPALKAGPPRAENPNMAN